MIRKRHEKLLHRAFPWALGVGVFLASFVTPLQTPWEVASRNYSLHIAGSFEVFLLAFLGGVTAAMVHRRIWPVCVVAVLAWLAYSMWPPMMVASFYAALRWKRRWLAVLYVTLAMLVVLVPIAAGTGEGAVSGIRFAAFTVPLMVIMPYTAGLWVRTRRQLIDELRASNSRLAAQARAEERTRIAREMHDVVAHRVALIVVHAGGLEVGARDEHTQREAELIRTTGREALNELRHVLGVLREPGPTPAPQPLLANLDHLVEQTRQAGVSVELSVDGELAGLPITVERSVYRLVQEALTNVVKHASGAPVEVLLRNASGVLEVTVRNGRPSRRAVALPSSGLGLIGLRERIELLGGKFEVGPLPEGGFQVSARLPTDQDVLQLPGEDVRRAV
ncbi:MAG TPA: sensor histidine kinase [Candidatus Limnocylindrales bacterium]|nr:sensor histidine kinase [Candidatus Limnocylindrales bacterium]